MADELIHELSAAYALDALDPHEREEFEQHLAGCERCREEVAGFAGTAASLAIAVPAVAPPRDLGERIVAAARAERPNVVPLRPRWTRVGLPLVAVAASFLLGALIFSRHSAPQLHSVAIEGANGSLVMDGQEAALVLTGLGRAPVGQTYEAWVLKNGAAEPAGTFRGDSGTMTFRLTRKVPSGAMVAVTVERAGGVSKPTRTPFVVSARV